MTKKLHLYGLGPSSSLEASDLKVVHTYIGKEDKQNRGKHGKDQMNNEDQRRGFIFVSLLKACAKKKDLIRGKRLHDDVTRKGLLEKIPYLAAQS